MSLIDSSKKVLIQPGQFIIEYIPGLHGIYVIKNADYGDNLQIRLYSVKLNKYLNQKPYQDISVNFSEGLLAVLVNEKVGYINENGELIVEPVYDGSFLGYANSEMPEHGMGEGEYSSHNMSSFYSDCSLIDVNKFSIENQIWKNKYDFSEGLAVVQIGEKYGYINKRGQIIIPIIYDYADAFINGVASVSIKENGASISKIINTKGNTIVSDFFIQSYSTDKKYVFGYIQIDENNQDYYRLNVTSGEIEKIISNFSSLSYYLNYVKGVYKDAEVYLNQKNVALMSSDINFSVFESNELVQKATKYIYNENERYLAINLLKKAIIQDPTNKNAYIELARTYKESNNHNEAISYFDKAIDLDTDNSNALQEKAEYSFEKKYYREAVETYEKLANKGSEDFSFYFNKGYAENEIGKLNESINSYTIYLNNYPNSSSAYNNRANCYFRNGLYQKAIEDYTAAIKYNNNESKESLGKYYNNRASSYYYLNKRVEACLDYKRAADLGNSSAINSYRNCK
jgi:tetratricopeptide (TPR) repeat protein